MALVAYKLVETKEGCQLLPGSFRERVGYASGEPGSQRNPIPGIQAPNYHLPTDTPETLDYEFLAGVTRLLVHAVLSSLTG